jgi:predicted Na+-dependent transporter
LETAKRKLTPAGIVGAILGFAFSRYVGVNVLVPIVGALLIAWVIKKRAAGPHPMAAAVAVQGGHFLWMLIGALFGGAAPAFVVETALFAAGVAWLYLQPRLLAAVVLGVYQVIALVVNLNAMRAVPLDSSEARALSVHVALRAIALVAMVWGLRAARQVPEAATQPTMH